MDENPSAPPLLEGNAKPEVEPAVVLRLPMSDANWNDGLLPGVKLATTASIGVGQYALKTYCVLADRSTAVASGWKANPPARVLTPAGIVTVASKSPDVVHSPTWCGSVSPGVSASQKPSAETDNGAAPT